MHAVTCHCPGFPPADLPDCSRAGSCLGSIDCRGVPPSAELPGVDVPQVCGRPPRRQYGAPPKSAKWRRGWLPGHGLRERDALCGSFELLASAFNLDPEHAITVVVVDQPHSLHERIYRRRADELPAALLQVLR